MNESGIAIDYVTMEGYWDGGSSYDVYYSHMSNESVSLVNGRSVTVPARWRPPATELILSPTGI